MPENENGSALSWIVILMLVMALTISSMMAIAALGHKQSVEININKQLHYSAFTMAKVLAEEICKNPEGYGKLLIETANREEADYYQTENLLIKGIDADMGQCYLKMEYQKSNKLLLLTVTAQRMEHFANVTATLKNKENTKVGTDQVENNLWEILQYYGE